MMKKLTVVSLVFLSAATQAQSHLDRVMKTKTLTVCATGDYKPYTHLLQDGKYEGICGPDGKSGHQSGSDS